MHSCRVPSDAAGPHLVQIAFDASPLAGKVTGASGVNVAGK